MTVEGRATNYDRIADRFDTRYRLYAYEGVRETLLNFLGPRPSAVLEVGCGTGHWLGALEARLKPSPYAEGRRAKASAERNAEGRSAKALAERNAEGRSAKALAERNAEGRSAKALADRRGDGSAKALAERNAEGRSAKASAERNAEGRSAKASAERNAEGRSAKASAERQLLAGVEPSAPMLARARVAAPGARLVRARAEELPWRDATFDRIFCVNALHHFADRHRFFAEARRVLTPGGGLLTIGKDPHTDRDEWWVYDYFEETRAIDRERCARVRTLRGEMALAGFTWTESMEADHVELVQSAAEALENGVVDAGFTSQLTVLSAEEFSRGTERLRQANEAAGGGLQLVADFRLYATVGWV